MPTPTEDQRARIHRTLAHIDEHLGDPLDLAALAEVAQFSKFHFHKVFRAVTGSSPQVYVKRRRLEWAHHFLASDPALSVSAVADLLGFSSPSNLARAFRQRFGKSPRDLRAPVPAPVAGRARALSLLEPPRVRLAPLEPFRVLYTRRAGLPPCHAAVEAILDEQRRCCARRGLVLPGARAVVIGKSLLGVATVEEFVYDYGVEIPSAARISDPGLVEAVGGGMHLLYEHHGPPETVLACWTELYRLWLPGTGLAARPGFAFTVIPPPGAPHGFLLHLPLRTGRVG